jgi:hypothetical protein
MKTVAKTCWEVVEVTRAVGRTSSAATKARFELRFGRTVHQKARTAQEADNLRRIAVFLNDRGLKPLPLAQCAADASCPDAYVKSAAKGMETARCTPELPLWSGNWTESRLAGAMPDG